MIWTIWRQHRAEALVVGIVLALLAAMMIVTGLQMTSAYQTLGVGPCLSPTDTNISCGQIIQNFRDQFNALEDYSSWLNFAPVFVAILIGAPLIAREIEQRTYLLAWTQSVTRRRWLLTKLALVVGGALLASAILTGLFLWWRSSFDQLNGRMAPIGFDFEGTVPLAYMTFAMALAIAAGTLLRRTILAMVVTLGGFLVARLSIENFVRPTLYETPVTLNIAPLSVGGPSRLDWELNFGFVDQSGHALDSQQVFTTCSTAAGPGSKLSFIQCVASHHWLFSYIYQPADRFWRFQITETLVYVALTVALLALAVWWAQQRIR